MSNCTQYKQYKCTTIINKLYEWTKKTIHRMSKRVYISSISGQNYQTKISQISYGPALIHELDITKLIHHVDRCIKYFACLDLTNKRIFNIKNDSSLRIFELFYHERSEMIGEIGPAGSLARDTWPDLSSELCQREHSNSSHPRRRPLAHSHPPRTGRRSSWN